MGQSELEALLGRPLTSREVANRKLYLDIAKENLEEILCLSIECDSVQEPRVFDVREGYSTVFTDIFSDISEVKSDGVVTTDFYKAFWDKRNNSYYNSIVLDDCDVKEVEITGTWGFDVLPNDLKRLWAQMFANVANKYKAGAGNVKRKDVRNFSITFGDKSDDDILLENNATTISKYSMCNIGYVKHGKTCTTHRKYDCGLCL